MENSYDLKSNIEDKEIQFLQEPNENSFQKIGLSIKDFVCCLNIWKNIKFNLNSIKKDYEVLLYQFYQEQKELKLLFDNSTLNQSKCNFKIFNEILYDENQIFSNINSENQSNVSEIICETDVIYSYLKPKIPYSDIRKSLVILQKNKLIYFFASILNIKKLNNNNNNNNNNINIHVDNNMHVNNGINNNSFETETNQDDSCKLIINVDIYLYLHKNSLKNSNLSKNLNIKNSMKNLIGWIDENYKLPNKEISNYKKKNKKVIKINSNELYDIFKDYNLSLKRMGSLYWKQPYGLKTDLRNYQKDAVLFAKMIEEGKIKIKLEYPPYWHLVQLPEINKDVKLYVNLINGEISNEIPLGGGDFIVNGGCLCDEMGLGKSLEIISLILLNQKRNDLNENTINIKNNNIISEKYLEEIKNYNELNDDIECPCGTKVSNIRIEKCQICKIKFHFQCCVNYLNESNNINDNFFCPICENTLLNKINVKTTLIIAPASIVEQWNDEINKHIEFGTLKIAKYNGVRTIQMNLRKNILNNKKKLSYFDENEIKTRNDISNYDIILTSYEILKEEIYHVLDKDQLLNKRSMRYKKTYPIFPSLLTNIDWWRIVLDEAQMTEGYSLVSKMTNKLSCKYKWCVSGTPIIKSCSNDLYGLLLNLSNVGFPFIENVLFKKYLSFISYEYFINEENLQDNNFEQNSIDKLNDKIQKSLNDTNNSVSYIINQFGSIKNIINNLEKMIGSIFYRREIKQVQEEINIPEPFYGKIILNPSSVEKFFYLKQCELAFNMIYNNNDNINIDDNNHHYIDDNDIHVNNCVDNNNNNNNNNNIHVNNGINNNLQDNDFNIENNVNNNNINDNINNQEININNNISYNSFNKKEIDYIINILRLACIHPQLGSMGINNNKHIKNISIEKDNLTSLNNGLKIMTMNQILDKLLNKCRIDIEESVRKYVMNTLGLAGLYIYKKEFEKAIEFYYQVIDIRNEDRVDILQQIHTLWNLNEISIYIKNIEKDKILTYKNECIKLEENYRSKYFQDYKEKYELYEKSKEKSNNIDYKNIINNWWHIFKNINNNSQQENILNKINNFLYEYRSAKDFDIQYQLPNITNINKLINILDIKINEMESYRTQIINSIEKFNFINSNQDDIMLNNMIKKLSSCKMCKESFNEIQNIPNNNNEIQNNINNNNKKKKLSYNEESCLFCNIQEDFELLEYSLYTIKKKNYSRSSNIYNNEFMDYDYLNNNNKKLYSDSIYLRDSEIVALIKLLYKEIKKNFDIKNEHILKILSSCNYHYKYIESLKSELINGKSYLSSIRQLINSYLELIDCKQRIQVINNSKNFSNQNNIINHIQVPYFIEKYESERNSALIIRKNLKSQQKFLYNLKLQEKFKYIENNSNQENNQNNNIIEIDICPICLNKIKYDSQVLLPCAHLLCIDCYKLIKKSNKIKNQCPKCRSNFLDINVVLIIPDNNSIHLKSNHINNELQLETNFINDNEFIYSKQILGNFGTKIEVIIKHIKWILEFYNYPNIQSQKLLFDIKNDDKILIFSDFQQVLDIISIALNLNQILFKKYNGKKSEYQILREFNENPNLRVLICSHLNVGKGINITIANHIIFINPLINKSDELQSIGRIIRMGQKKKPHIWYFIIKDSIEELIFNILQKENQQNIYLNNNQSIYIKLINHLFQINTSASKIINS